jgi:hypothetical protein
MPGMTSAIHPARRIAALVAAFGTLAPLIALRFASWAHGSGVGGGSVGRIEYRIHSVPHWTGTVATVLAVLLAIAAAGLWAARDRRVLALVVVAGLAGAVGTVAATARAATRGVSSPADYDALPLGSTRADVRDRLGSPPGHGSGTTRRGTPLECDAYWAASSDGTHLYCYAGDRLVFKDAH